MSGFRISVRYELLVNVPVASFSVRSIVAMVTEYRGQLVEMRDWKNQISTMTTILP